MFPESRESTPQGGHQAGLSHPAGKGKKGNDGVAVSIRASGLVASAGAKTECSAYQRVDAYPRVEPAVVRLDLDS